MTLAAGQFAIFFPGEVHKPMSNYQGQESSVKKAIVKLRYDQI
ncbi:YhcH/YjgK/YiaL family protein [Vibrio paracholerae]|nr:YhcH/YjgK/YiaL family protein [Vibrio paracholerae]